MKNIKYKSLGEVIIWDRRFKNIPKEYQKKIIKFKHIQVNMIKDIIDKERGGDVRIFTAGKFEGYTIKERS